MKDDSKIRLSPQELDTLREKDFFFEKRIITGKIYHQLAQVIEETKAEHIFDGIDFPQGADFITGKISKGENYLGLPFIMLDFPKFFSRTNILAIRTMIWWGNFCSTTLVLSGEPLDTRRKKLERQFGLLRKNSFSVCIHESPWHHHFEDDNFIPAQKLDAEQWRKSVREHSFFKVGRKIPISNINRLNNFSLQSFKVFAELL